MKQALLIASFGSTVPEAEKDIAAVEAALAAAAPGWQAARAFTSGMVRRALAARGRTVDSVPEALARLRRAGCRDVFVQPTHFLCGVEYDKLKAEAEAAAAGFDRVRVGRPLLDGEESLRRVAGILDELYPAEAGRAVVLMGHGTRSEANGSYACLQQMLEEGGRPDIRIGTVESLPDIGAVCGWLQGRPDIRRVSLAPLMLVAGDHIRNDMAGEDAGSWRGILAAAGYEVRCTLRGLGSEEKVQALYAASLQKAL